MYPEITLHGMRQKIFAGKFEIVLYLGSTQKGQIIMQNLAFNITLWPILGKFVPKPYKNKSCFLGYICYLLPSETTFFVSKWPQKWVFKEKKNSKFLTPQVGFEPLQLCIQAKKVLRYLPTKPPELFWHYVYEWNFMFLK